MVTPLTSDFERRIQDYTSFLFDFDDTLVDYSKNEHMSLQSIFNELKIESEKFPEFKRTFHKINIEHWKLYREKKISAENINPSRFMELAQTFPEISDPVSTSERYLYYFSQYAIPFDGALDYLAYLKREGHQTFILTNGFTETLHVRIKKSGIDTLIDGYLTSQMVGVAKPDPKMVTEALKILNSSPNEAIFIGDKLDSDILAAHRAGIDSLHITDVVVDYHDILPVAFTDEVSTLYSYHKGIVTSRREEVQM